MLECIATANDILGANIRATLLTRDPQRFARELPRLALRREFDWLTGETDDFGFPGGHFDFVVHLATPSAAELTSGGVALALSTLQGTRRVLHFAQTCGAKRLLFASSGAVYGCQPPDLSHISEDFCGAPNVFTPMSAYGEIKRMSELMCTLSPKLECVIGRLFSFIGPYLPLTEKFAVGSFIRDALAGGPIHIHGDGTPLRSYLYGADLAIWLFTLLVKGKPFVAYNVGSDSGVSLRELAECIAAHSPSAVRTIVRNGTVSAPTSTYVPSIQRARTEFGLDVKLDLMASIARSMTWAMAAR